MGNEAHRQLFHADAVRPYASVSGTDAAITGVLLKSSKPWIRTGVPIMPSRTTRASSLLVLLFVVAFAGPALADYIDTVILTNGNRITGNVKGLAQGQLGFDTDAMGTVSIEWDKVAEILSATPMQVETTGGIRYFGQLEKPPRDAKVTVKSKESAKTIEIADVVHITPIADSFWGRIQGSLSAGFSFTKSSDVAQFSLSGNAVYRTRRNQFTLKLH